MPDNEILVVIVTTVLGSYILKSDEQLGRPQKSNVAKEATSLSSREKAPHIVLKTSTIICGKYYLRKVT